MTQQSTSLRIPLQRPLRLAAMALFVALAASGCTVFSADLQLRPEDQRGLAIDRYGKAAISSDLSTKYNRGKVHFVSQQPGSTVVFNPGTAWESYGHPLPVLMIQNLQNGNVEVTERSVEFYLNGGPLTVYTYQDWHDKQKSRSLAASILTFAAVADLLDSPSECGNYNCSDEWRAAFGLYAGLEAGAAIEEGIEKLGQNYLQRHTLAKGEWYGGSLYLGRLRGLEPGSTVDIVVRVGSDRHHFPLIAY